ncbi:MAG: response regulator transcription factor [Bdellovibrionales bacterium]|jgi:DNA-binding response OmpR family regulator|nr:response regulator transcription factor [Bdellovibrionales bacterium]
MSKILLVEDDENLGPSLKKYLEDEGFTLELVATLKLAKRDPKKFDMIILDWMLPDGQGLDFLRELRAQKINIPVIMLTARADLVDRILGLETGASDYMTKPFEPRELVARIRVQLRNVKSSHEFLESDHLDLGALHIDDLKREVYFEDHKIELTKMEYELLRLMAREPGRAFSREEILNKVWGMENYPSTRTVDTHVLQIRQKTKDDLIETLRGIGYRMKA